MIFVLSAMNNVSSWFGDAAMTQEQIEKHVDEIFEEADVSGTGSLSYAEYMTAVVNHPILVQFVTGGGTVRA